MAKTKIIKIKVEPMMWMMKWMKKVMRKKELKMVIIKMTKQSKNE